MEYELFNSIPEGFAYYPGFLSHEEEDELLQLIMGIELQSFIFQGFPAKRTVKSFGFDYSFDSRKLSKGEEIPQAFLPVIEKVGQTTGIPPEAFVELLVTGYVEGSVINWHRDAPPFGIIAGISLLSDCRFMFRPAEKARQGRKAIISYPVQRRSLYVMKGSARSDWQHSIAPVKQQRYSITLRTLNSHFK
jgi:alkylated DNA repair dioxygenase AlkB